MTNEEAIKILHPKTTEIALSGMSHIEAVDKVEIASIIACEALEKQIPKKVKSRNRHGDGPDVWNEDYYACPSCGRRLRNKQHDNHCGRCGQALDWSDSE